MDFVVCMSPWGSSSQSVEVLRVGSLGTGAVPGAAGPASGNVVGGMAPFHHFADRGWVDGDSYTHGLKVDEWVNGWPWAPQEVVGYCG